MKKKINICFFLLFACQTIKLGSFFGLCNAAYKLSLPHFFLSKLKTIPERGTLALLWEFSWEEPKSWKSLQNAKSEYENLGGENELKMIVSLMMDPVHVSVHCAGVLFDHRQSLFYLFSLQCMNTEVVVVPQCENCWCITINTYDIILHSPPSSSPRDIDPARVNKCFGSELLVLF